MRVGWIVAAVCVVAPAYAEPLIDADLLMKSRGSGDQNYSIFVELGALSGVLRYCNFSQEVSQLARSSVPMIDSFIEKYPPKGESPERTKLINTNHASYILGVVDGVAEHRRDFYQNANLPPKAREEICDKARKAFKKVTGEK